MCLFRMLQEALDNAVKFSWASKIEVLLPVTDSLLQPQIITTELASHGMVPRRGLGFVRYGRMDPTSGRSAQNRCATRAPAPRYEPECRYHRNYRDLASRSLLPRAVARVSFFSIMRLCLNSAFIGN